MPIGIKTPGEYSTNPSTVKGRRRKMNLSAAQKVEEAAKLADYKAMLHSRKIVKQDPEFAHASESEKATMLEAAMRQTMEKRYVYCLSSRPSHFHLRNRLIGFG